MIESLYFIQEFLAVLRPFFNVLVILLLGLFATRIDDYCTKTIVLFGNVWAAWIVFNL